MGSVQQVLTALPITLKSVHHVTRDFIHRIALVPKIHAPAQTEQQKQELIALLMEVQNAVPV